MDIKEAATTIWNAFNGDRPVEWVIRSRIRTPRLHRREDGERFFRGGVPLRDYERPGARSDGLSVVSRQLDAPDVPACGPGFPPSACVLSFTWSRPKYEKPGIEASLAGATQCAADTVPGKTANDMVSASPTMNRLGSFVYDYLYCRLFGG